MLSKTLVILSVFKLIGQVFGQTSGPPEFGFQNLPDAIFGIDLSSKTVPKVGGFGIDSPSNVDANANPSGPADPTSFFAREIIFPKSALANSIRSDSQVLIPNSFVDPEAPVDSTTDTNLQKDFGVANSHKQLSNGFTENNFINSDPHLTQQVDKIVTDSGNTALSDVLTTPIKNKGTTENKQDSLNSLLDQNIISLNPPPLPNDAVASPVLVEGPSFIPVINEIAPSVDKLPLALEPIVSTVPNISPISVLNEHSGVLNNDKGTSLKNTILPMEAIENGIEDAVVPHIPNNSQQTVDSTVDKIVANRASSFNKQFSPDLSKLPDFADNVNLGADNTINSKANTRLGNSNFAIDTPPRDTEETNNLKRLPKHASDQPETVDLSSSSKASNTKLPHFPSAVPTVLISRRPIDWTGNRIQSIQSEGPNPFGLNIEKPSTPWESWLHNSILKEPEKKTVDTHITQAIQNTIENVKELQKVPETRGIDMKPDTTSVQSGGKVDHNHVHQPVTLLDTNDVSNTGNAEVAQTTFFDTERNVKNEKETGQDLNLNNGLHQSNINAISQLDKHIHETPTLSAGVNAPVTKIKLQGSSTKSQNNANLSSDNSKHLPLSNIQNELIAGNNQNSPNIKDSLNKISKNMKPEFPTLSDSISPPTLKNKIKTPSPTDSHNHLSSRSNLHSHISNDINVNEIGLQVKPPTLSAGVNPPTVRSKVEALPIENNQNQINVNPFSSSGVQNVNTKASPTINEQRNFALHNRMLVPSSGLGEVMRLLQRGGTASNSESNNQFVIDEIRPVGNDGQVSSTDYSFFVLRRFDVNGADINTIFPSINLAMPSPAAQPVQFQGLRAPLTKPFNQGTMNGIVPNSVQDVQNNVFSTNSNFPTKIPNLDNQPGIFSSTSIRSDVNPDPPNGGLQISDEIMSNILTGPGDVLQNSASLGTNNIALGNIRGERKENGIVPPSQLPTSALGELLQASKADALSGQPFGRDIPNFPFSSSNSEVVSDRSQISALKQTQNSGHVEIGGVKISDKVIKLSSNDLESIRSGSEVSILDPPRDAQGRRVGSVVLAEPKGSILSISMGDVNRDIQGQRVGSVVLTNPDGHIISRSMGNFNRDIQNQKEGSALLLDRSTISRSAKNGENQILNQRHTGLLHGAAMQERKAFQPTVDREQPKTHTQAGFIREQNTINHISTSKDNIPGSFRDNSISNNALNSQIQNNLLQNNVHTHSSNSQNVKVNNVPPISTSSQVHSSSESSTQSVEPTKTSSSNDGPPMPPGFENILANLPANNDNQITVINLDGNFGIASVNHVSSADELNFIPPSSDLDTIHPKRTPHQPSPQPDLQQNSNSFNPDRSRVVDSSSHGVNTADLRFDFSQRTSDIANIVNNRESQSVHNSDSGRQGQQPEIQNNPVDLLLPVRETFDHQSDRNRIPSSRDTNIGEPVRFDIGSGAQSRNFIRREPPSRSRVEQESREFHERFRNRIIPPHSRDRHQHREITPTREPPPRFSDSFNSRRNNFRDFPDRPNERHREIRRFNENRNRRREDSRGNSRNRENRGNRNRGSGSSDNRNRDWIRESQAIVEASISNHSPEQQPNRRNQEGFVQAMRRILLQEARQS